MTAKPEAITLDVGGIAMQVVAESAGHLACITGRLGTVPSIKPAELTIAIGTDDGGRPPTHIDIRLEGCDFTTVGESVFLRLDGEAVAEVAGNHLRVTGPADSTEQRKELNDLTQFGLAVAVAGRDRAMLHGATIGRDGQAVVVVGLSGQGKSTLAASALAAGWDLLGDDLCIVQPEARLVTAVQRPPLIPGRIAAANEMGGTPVKEKRDRVQLSADVLTPDTYQFVGLIEVDHDDGDGMLEIVDQPDLEIFDAGLAVPPAEPVARRHLAVAASLIRLPQVRLYHAADPEVRVERAQQLLAEAFTHCQQRL